MLELGVDVGATGLDKYGTVGPRFGLLAGRKDLVERIRAKGSNLASRCRPMLYPAVVRTLENYSPQAGAATSSPPPRRWRAELRVLIGDRLRETPTTAQLSADDLLADRHGTRRGQPGTDRAVRGHAALCMLLLRDYNMLTVHFVGMPPGGADLLIKFMPPETLARFGGAAKFAAALDASLTKLGRIAAQDPDSVRDTLLGSNRDVLRQ